MRQGKAQKIGTATAVIAVAVGSLAFAADGALVGKSKRIEVKAMSSASKSISCRGAGRATAAGFEGDARITPDSYRVLFAEEQTLSSRAGTTGLFTSGANPVTGRGHVYCGGPQLERSSESRTIKAGAGRVSTVTARCGKGETPFSGGFRSEYEYPETVVAVGSYRSSRRSWSVEFFSILQQKSPVRVDAYCASARPLTARSKTRALTQRSESKVVPLNIDARCKPGEKLVSGGFRPKVQPSDNGPLTAASFEANERTWRIRAADLGNRPRPSRVSSIAYCAR